MPSPNRRTPTRPRTAARERDGAAEKTTIRDWKPYEFTTEHAWDAVAASSGRTQRHRLNFAPNRDANRALHMIVIVRLRYCERTRSYTDRRLAEGKTKKKPSAASNASSPASSTAHCEATSPPSQPALDIYRNVPG